MRILPKILRFRWRSVPVLPWPRVLLLGMLCLRALVPAGFMLGPVDGHVGMVLCEANAAGMPAHHHHPGMQHAPQHAGHDPTCPYAQSAGPAPLPALPVLAGAPLSATLTARLDSQQTLPLSGPVRQPSSRGPPRA